jgi:ABC-type transport system involved in Fe-S cluster assembly fused permease/ATPase subunit
MAQDSLLSIIKKTLKQDRVMSESDRRMQAKPEDVESLFNYYRVKDFDYRQIQNDEKMKGILKRYSLLRELAAKGNPA